MKKSIPRFFLSLAGLMLVSGCSSVNETLWHSLKARDSNLHPSLDQPRPTEKPMSYDEYATERKKAVEKNQ